MNETEALIKLCMSKDVDAIKGLFCSDCKIVQNNIPWYIIAVIIVLVGTIGYMAAKRSRIQNI